MPPPEFIEAFCAQLAEPRALRNISPIRSAGHAPITMAMRYAHLAPEISREAVRLLDNGANLRSSGSVVAASAEN